MHTGQRALWGGGGCCVITQCLGKQVQTMYPCLSQVLRQEWAAVYTQPFHLKGFLTGVWLCVGLVGEHKKRSHKCIHPAFVFPSSTQTSLYSICILFVIGMRTGSRAHSDWTELNS